MLGFNFPTGTGSKNGRLLQGVDDRLRHHPKGSDLLKAQNRGKFGPGTVRHLVNVGNLPSAGVIIAGVISPCFAFATPPARYRGGLLQSFIARSRLQSKRRGQAGQVYAGM
jgi:hypothetical protein